MAAMIRKIELGRIWLSALIRAASAVAGYARCSRWSLAPAFGKPDGFGSICVFVRVQNGSPVPLCSHFEFRPIAPTAELLAWQ
jgi:hypothetical protein